MFRSFILRGAGSLHVANLFEVRVEEIFLVMREAPLGAAARRIGRALNSSKVAL
jgi:hypothetical protein